MIFGACALNHVPQLAVYASGLLIYILLYTSHQNRSGVFKIHHKEFSTLFKCYSFKYVCSNLPTLVDIRIIDVHVCRVHSLQSVSQHQFHTRVSIR